jgi:transposase InsO family protein
MGQKNDHPYVEKRLKPGWYMYWKHQTYRVILPDQKDPLTLYVENTTTSEVRSFSFTELWRSDSDDDGPIFAPTLDQLRREIDKRHPIPEIAPTMGIPAANIKKADHILSVVEQVKKLVPVAQARLEKERKEKERAGEPTREATNTDILRMACTLLKPKPIKLSTLYKYRGCINQYHGDRSAIAASFRRSTYHKMKLDKATLHFLDTIIPLYCGRKRPAEIYRLGESALVYRTQGLWLDPTLCNGPIPAALVSELKQVLHREIPMQALLENEKTKGLLTKIEMPALGLFYNYHRWFLAQPDQGRKALNDSYGEGTWESFFTIFDTFAHRATFPLQYVFADHYLVDVFTVDKATRSKLDRLWLTVLIDAYTRCILGAVLLYEEPCIYSIQSALLHAIWPKSSHTRYGIAKDWACFGIPQQLYLDNALAHHSHSLENLARQIGFRGKYQTIDLVFRPPYMARYGALIESLFGHLSGRIKQDLAGAIKSSAPKDLRKAAKEACLLYEDIDRYIQQFILRYQHTPHKALGEMSPHDKWMESVERIGLPDIPKLSPQVRRLFLREVPDTRKITDKGICLFGMHYTSDALDTANRIEVSGSDVEYGIRYDQSDISTISIYDGDVFKGELKAKELRLPDGSLKQTSEWELKMAKALAKKNEGSREDWLSYLNDAKELEKKRRAERDRIRRPRKRLAQEERGEDELAKIEESVEDISSDDEFLTAQLADFLS